MSRGLLRRALAIFVAFARNSGHEHPNLHDAIGNYAELLKAMGKSEAEIKAAIDAILKDGAAKRGD